MDPFLESLQIHLEALWNPYGILFWKPMESLSGIPMHPFLKSLQTHLEALWSPFLEARNPYGIPSDTYGIPFWNAYGNPYGSLSGSPVESLSRMPFLESLYGNIPLAGLAAAGFFFGAALLLAFAAAAGFFIAFGAIAGYELELKACGVELVPF